MFNAFRHQNCAGIVGGFLCATPMHLTYIQQRWRYSTLGYLSAVFIHTANTNLHYSYWSFCVSLYTQLTQIYITAIGHSVPFITKFYVIHMWQLQKLMQSVTGNKEYNNDEVSVLWIIVDKKPKKTVHAAQR